MFFSSITTILLLSSCTIFYPLIAEPINEQINQTTINDSNNFLLDQISRQSNKTASGLFDKNSILNSSPGTYNQGNSQNSAIDGQHDNQPVNQDDKMQNLVDNPDNQIEDLEDEEVLLKKILLIFLSSQY